MLFVSQQNYDNGDAQLDSSEFLKFIQHNETAINITSPYAEEENNRLLRSNIQQSPYTHLQSSWYCEFMYSKLYSVTFS